MSFKDAELVSNLSQGPCDVARIGVFGDDAKGSAFTAPADEDWDSLLNWPGIVEDVGDRVIRSSEAGRSGIEHRPADLDELVHSIHPLRGRWEADSVPLMLSLIPTCADAQDCPSFGHHVQGSHDLREQGRVPEGHGRN